jgi:hypothetical protein
MAGRKCGIRSSTELAFFSPLVILGQPDHLARCVGSEGFSRRSLRRPREKADQKQYREDAMERFFSERNIERYRMLANPTDETQRKMILKLLAEERAKLREEIAQARELA